MLPDSGYMYIQDDGEINNIIFVQTINLNGNWKKQQLKQSKYLKLNQL